jgi:hypothetical protein
MDSQTTPIVADHRFVLATRDTGYRSPATALAELIDNSLQAAARSVAVHFLEAVYQNELSVATIDDGKGMDAATLRTALQFGGTPRFNDRAGQGRFGMGLPNSSMSQARRVDVYSWLKPRDVLHSYLDVDEIVRGDLRQVPPPVPRSLPPWADSVAANTGTLIVWSKCDRLLHLNSPSFLKEVRSALGQMFRYFLWKGASISVNGTILDPIDPLFLTGTLEVARQYGRPLTYRVRVPTSTRRTSVIRARFTELPIAEWHDLPLSIKRVIGLAKGAGVSVVRAGREIAFGWHFMGNKRKENYDDWWRCEVAFEPDLDEYFGVTHSKQGINPTPELVQILYPDLEATAHTLNSRVRKQFAGLRTEALGLAMKTATEKERQLPPITRESRPSRNRGANGSLMDTSGRLRYRLTVAPLAQEYFYSFRLAGGRLLLTINQEHPFFSRIYKPLRESALPRDRFPVECLLLALARAEAAASSSAQRYWYRRARFTLSNVLAAFLGG